MVKKVSLKKALQLYGAENIKINKGYNYRSGFFNKDGQCYFFSYGDIRWSPTFLIRTAKNRKDYVGGTNTYGFETWLFNQGYELEIKPEKCDFNGN